MEKIRALLHVKPVPDLPPPYVEQIENIFFESSPNGTFPAKFTTYGPSGSSKRWLLGARRDAPLYAVSRRDASCDNDKADVVLHSGLSRRDSALAWCRFVYPSEMMGDNNNNNLMSARGNAKMWRVRLPPRRDETDPSLEIVSAGTGWKDANKRPVFRFSVETDVVGVREAFEWRCSNNDRIHGILEGQSLGWKLVRMVEDDLTARIPCPKGVWPKSSEGKETVAVCSGNVEGGTRDWPFAFIGTGRSGVLGQRWEIMAVMTSLLIMDWTLKIDRNSGLMIPEWRFRLSEDAEHLLQE